LQKKASPPIHREEGWRFKSSKTADCYLAGAVAGAAVFSLLVFVEEELDFLVFLVFFGFASVLEDDFVVVLDLSSAANAPKLMERANMATMIKDSNFFIGLPP
jgi:hypothetical protein